jgi:hypothetical protein
VRAEVTGVPTGRQRPHSSPFRSRPLLRDRKSGQGSACQPCALRVSTVSNMVLGGTG